MKPVTPRLSASAELWHRTGCSRLHDLLCDMLLAAATALTAPPAERGCNDE